MPEKGTIHSAIRATALTKVRDLDDEAVLSALRESGINSLEELVGNVLEHYRNVEVGTGPEVAYDTFIYEQFIYKAAMPIDQEQLVTLENAVKQVERIQAIER